MIEIIVVKVNLKLQNKLVPSNWAFWSQNQTVKIHRADFVIYFRIEITAERLQNTLVDFVADILKVVKIG